MYVSLMASDCHVFMQSLWVADGCAMSEHRPTSMIALLHTKKETVGNATVAYL